MELTVEYDSGKTATVTMKKLKYKEWKRISRIIAPKMVSTDMKAEIDYEASVKYGEELIKACVVSPDDLKADEGLWELTKDSYDKLLEGASKLNNLTIEKEKNL
jgi:hypothetical protein